MRNLWGQLARAVTALQARLEMCGHVEKMPYEMYQLADDGSGGTYQGTLYLSEDYYVVIARRYKHKRG